MGQTAIVVASDEKDGIGCQNRLPWKIPSETKWFRDLTTSGEKNAVIMGTNTWESCKGVKFEGRMKIVLSRSLVETGDDTLISRSLDEAIGLCIHHNITHTWIIGGAKVYREALTAVYCDKIILSRVKGVHDCDTFFPAHSFTRVEHPSYLPIQPPTDEEWQVEVYVKNPPRQRNHD